jgi:hypothetical protein
MLLKTKATTNEAMNINNSSTATVIHCVPMILLDFVYWSEAWEATAGWGVALPWILPLPTMTDVAYF